MRHAGNPVVEHDASRGWVVARWVIALAVAGLIVVAAMVAAVGGSHNHMNAGVVFGIGLALLPAGIYAFGVRTRTSTALAGALLVGVTGLAWGIFLVGHRESAFAGAFIIPAFFITLLSSSLAAARDQRGR